MKIRVNHRILGASFRALLLLLIGIALHIMLTGCTNSSGTGPDALISEEPLYPATVGDAMFSSDLILTENDVFSRIDSVLGGLETGSLVLSAPESMRMDESALVELVVGFGEDIDQLKDEIDNLGELFSADVQLSSYMEAQLTSFDFEVAPISPPLQIVSRSEPTAWRWRIAPKTGGTLELDVCLIALVDVDGTSRKREIKTFERVIHVEVSFGQRITKFVVANWKWIASVLILPGGGALYAWLRRKRRRSKSGNPGMSDQI